MKKRRQRSADASEQAGRGDQGREHEVAHATGFVRMTSVNVSDRVKAVADDNGVLVRHHDLGPRRRG